MKFSVITVCWNAAGTIGDTLASVAAQIGPEVEHIIIDGGSTDGTLEIVERFARPGLHVLSGPDKGIYDAMNKGLALATGDVIGFLNADDFFCRTDALALIESGFRADPECGAVAGGIVLVDPSDVTQVIRAISTRSYGRWMARFGIMVPHPAVYTRRPLANRIGLFRPDFRISSDFDWLVRLLYGHSKRIAPLGVTLVTQRQGGISTQGLASLKVGNAEISKALKANGIFSTPAMVWSKYLLKGLQLLRKPQDYPAPEAQRWPPAGADLGFVNRRPAASRIE